MHLTPGGTSAGPSWGAFVFAWIYLAAMRQYRAAAVMALLMGLVIITMISAGAPRLVGYAAALAYVGLWAYFTMRGRRLAWESGQWVDARALERRQREWDRWALIALLLILPLLVVGIVTAVAPERRAPLIVLMVFAGLAVIVGMHVRNSRSAPQPVRAGVPQAAEPRDAAVELVPPAQRRAVGGFPAATPVVRLPAADPPLLLVRAAADALTMMIRRPTLALPFLLMVAAVLAVALLIIVTTGITGPINPASGERLISQAPWAFVIVILAAVFLYILAGETTSHLAAQIELGSVPALGTAVTTALRRLPAYFVANILWVLGVVFGFVFFIVPGVMLAVRWMLVPPATIVGGTGPVSAFRISRSLTIGRWWRFLGFGLLMFVCGLAIDGVLDTIPYVGSFVSAWLAFSWFTIALTLAYLRVGGPVK